MLLRVVGGVLLDELFLILRYVIQRVDRIGGTRRYAGSTVDALFRVDIHLGYAFELRLILLGVDAICRAHLDAQRIFDTAISDYVGHDESVSRGKGAYLPPTQQGV